MTPLAHGRSSFKQRIGGGRMTHHLALPARRNHIKHNGHLKHCSGLLDLNGRHLLVECCGRTELAHPTAMTEAPC